MNYPIGSMNFDPDPTQYPDMSDFLNNRLIPCFNLADAGFFSNVWEGKYHDHGHSSVGGRFNEPDAPACLIFWPWHAWIDDLWYAWERDCGYDSTEAYDIPTTPGATEYVVNGSETWAGEMFVKGIVRIPSGAELNIFVGATIHFRSSDYEAFPTRIIVEPGGTLFVQSGATLTGIGVFGSGNEGGVNYATGWDGIIVQGTGNLSGHGLVQLESNSRIEHTVNGIRSENGGIIIANQANFYNNRCDVEILSYAFDHGSAFTGCNIINDQPLRDVEWSPSVCGEGEHYFGVYNRSRSSENHIVLKGINGITFDGCTIDNPFKESKLNYVSRGILSYDSRYEVKNCNIKNQVRGIDAGNYLPGPGREVTVRNSTFDRNYQGIVLHGVDMSKIEDNNTFIVPDAVPNGLVALGIYSDGAAGLVIDNNGYSSSGGTYLPDNYGALLANTSGVAASVERRDDFTGLGIASQAQGENGNLQIRCNTYAEFNYAIAVTSGTLANQGECGTPASPANNTWDNLGTCIGDESQIYKDPAATTFEYRAHTNQLPTCYSDGVTPFDCNSTSDPTSCANGLEFPCAGCELQRITELEAAKDALPPGDGHIPFIVYEQQLVYQHGVNERLENGNTGLDDAIEFTEDVEAVTDLWPGNKAALLLLKSEQGTIASGTSAAIAAIAETDPNKKWFTLRFNLLTSGRSYSQLTSTEKAMVEAEAAQHTKSGAHAKAILAMEYGIPTELHVEEINLERSSKPAKVATASSGLNIAPNPAQNNVVVSFTAPETAHQSFLEIADINGRALRQFDLSNHFGDSQEVVPVDGFSPGIYLVKLSLNGFVVGVEKMVVIR